MIDELIEFVKNEDNLAEQYVEAHDDNKSVFLYGAGVAAMWYVEYLKRNQIVVSGLMVSNMEGQPSQKYGIPIVHVDEVFQKHRDIEIVIASPMYKDEIETELCKRIDHRSVFSFETELYCNFIESVSGLRAYYLDNMDQIEHLYNCLQDDLSKETLLAFIKGRVSGNHDFYRAVRVDAPYYPSDIISLTDEEVLVELGSNNGDTLRDFLNVTKRKYRKCICFEPDKRCIEMLKKLRDAEEGCIEIIEKGAYSKKAIFHFDVDSNDENHATAHISEETSGVEIEVDACDNCINERITFLKMDIEGSELEALKGCCGLLKQYKPKIAVSAYHNNEDLLNIFQFIEGLDLGYRFYLRHHNHSATDTIMYAV